MIVRERILRNIVVADRQKNIVERFTQTIEERVLLHHAIEQRRQRLRAFTLDLRQLFLLRKSPSQRERCATQERALVEHFHAFKKWRRILVFN